jgi:hypothetical protein
MDTRAIIGVIDNLTSNSTTDALSANQGRVLKGLIDNIGSDLPLLVGTDSKVIVIDNLVNGVYMLTGKYKYTNKTAIGTTSERFLINVYHSGNELHFTLFSPMGVMRRVIAEDGVVTTNNYVQIKEDKIILNGKVIPILDSGYSNITLKSGITVHNSATYPVRCKKQGNIVFIEGAVKGVTTKAKELGVLPVGYRPSKALYFTQARTGGKIDTLQISTNGLIEIMNSTATTFNASDYHFISTSFII